MRCLAWLVVLGTLVAGAANAAESVLYFGSGPLASRDASSPRMTLVHQGDAGLGIRVESLELVNADRSGVPELAGAKIPVGALASPGRYQLTLTLLPGEAWEDGQVRIVAVGRRVTGSGPVEFRRELDGWFLTYP